MITFIEYVENTRRTWNYQDKEKDNKHAILGLIDELGELASCLKKFIGYNKTLDYDNLAEEIGDMSYFIARLMDQNMDYSSLENIEKIINTHSIKGNEDSIYNLIMKLNSNIYLLNDIFYFNTLNNNNIFNLMIMNLCFLSQHTHLNYKQILKANIDKLKERFPNKFDYNLVDEENRNREKEIQAIKKNYNREK